MKFIIWVIVILFLLGAGYMVLDYFGYYIEWNIPAKYLVVLLPVAQAIRNFFQRPEKIFNKRNDDGAKS